MSVTVSGTGGSYGSKLSMIRSCATRSAARSEKS
jgi:hypothetical protein